MPKLEIDRGAIHFEESGAGDETIVFSHGLLWSTRLYDPQIAAFSSDYRCLAYDHRGQGQSDVPAGPLVDMETLYLDAVRLIEARDAGPCHFVGLSMGGFVGLRLAARRPDLLRSLILLDTAADPEPRSNIPKYRKLNAVARYLGIQLVSGQVMPIMFGESFLNDPNRAGERDKWRAELEGNRRSIYKAVNGVIYRPSVEREASRIDLPTLVLWGEEDNAISRDRCEALADLIDDAEFVTIPEAGHSSTIENPAAVNREISAFLERHT
ncbi:MAG: alpha/beta fold hydrolase [Myxococcota bacterium]